MTSPDANNTRDERLIIGADIPLDSNRYPIEKMLEAFREVSKLRDDVRLVFAGKRVPEDAFSVWNFLDQHQLTDSVTFLPYYERCNRFPVKKMDCWRWIGRDIVSADISADSLLSQSKQFDNANDKIALIITSCHPERHDGNARVFRHWLAHLRAAGYRIHLLYYATDRDIVTDEMRLRIRVGLELYREVAVTTKSVGHNRVDLNVHVDDWCGKEALDAASDLASKYEYDVAVVNYGFMSAVFDCLPPYTKKILVPHDWSFDRNRHIYAQGYTGAGLVSIDRGGVTDACDRSDIIVALQEHEAEEFGKLCGDAGKVRVVAPVFPSSPVVPTESVDGRFRIGYLGSLNFVNEDSLAVYLRAWLTNQDLAENSEIILAGDRRVDFVDCLNDGEELLASVNPKMLGRLDNLAEFFACCDIVINPDHRATAIKFNTLEAMAANIAVVATAAGAVGIGSNSRFHTAADAAALADLTAEIAKDRQLLKVARQDTVDAYKRYVERNQAAMDGLFGPVLGAQSWSESANTNSKRRRLISTRAEPFVSLIVPFYNVEAYIKACILSILGQDYENIEIIFVDDASPDGTRAIVEHYASRDSRIIVETHTNNQGLGSARNTGVQHASGEYLFFLDSDDFLTSPTAIRTLVDAARRHGNNIVVGACVNLFDDGTITDRDLADARGRLNASGGEVKGMDAFLAGLGVSTAYYLPPRACGALINRKFYNQLGLTFPSGEHEDLGFTPFIYAMSGGVLFLTDIIFTYRARSGSISHTPWTKGHLQRYRNLWRGIKANIQRFSLTEGLSSSALQMAGHMIWRMQTNNFDPEGRDEAISAIVEIFKDITVVSNYSYFFNVIDITREFLGDPTKETTDYRMVLSALQHKHLLQYYFNRLEAPRLAET